MNAEAPARSLSAAQRRAAALITVGAVALYLFMRWLPTGTNLNHMDFRVDAKNAIEFCDPANPQFIPVVAVKSPVQLSLQAEPAPAQGRETRFVLTMRTASGKPIAPEDLLVVHTQKLHVMAVDPTLQDYHHVHPTPGRRAGEWRFALTPERVGTYLVFADFTPAATQRGLYASAQFEVPGVVPRVMRTTNWSDTQGPFRFELSTPQVEIHAGAPTQLQLAISRADGGPVPLQPVMGAFAHLVAFDEERTGFAHLHPDQVDLAQPPDPVNPKLSFRITIPRAGRYVIWAQFNLEGKEAFVPFWVDVLPM